MRLMTWNCLGMQFRTKQTQLLDYMKAESIDLTILQEGDESFHNAQSEACGAGGVFIIGDSTDAAKMLRLTFSTGLTDSIAPVAGVGRKAYYNVVGDSAGFKLVDDGRAVDYQGSAQLREWIYAPVTAAKSERRLKLEETRRPKIVAGMFGKDRPLTKLIDEELRQPTQQRINLLGHRRPKKLEVPMADMAIYYWHAPLGSLNLSGLSLGNSQDYKGLGCNGDLAIGANLLFSKFLLAGKDEFPKKTILCGDLNIKPEAAVKIYKTRNVVSDGEQGWCHVIAAESMPLTCITNLLDTSRLGYSDHPPIVVEF